MLKIWGDSTGSLVVNVYPSKQTIIPAHSEVPWVGSDPAEKGICFLLAEHLVPLHPQPIFYLKCLCLPPTPTPRRGSHPVFRAQLPREPCAAPAATGREPRCSILGPPGPWTDRAVFLTLPPSSTQQGACASLLCCHLVLCSSAHEQKRTCVLTTGNV